MNKKMWCLILINFCFFSSATINAKETKNEGFYAKANLYFVPANSEKGTQLLANFQIFNEEMIEIHSNKKRELPGGYWNLELRLSKDNQLKTYYWQSEGVSGGEHWLESGQKNVFRQSVSIVPPGASSLVISEKTKGGNLVLDITPFVNQKENEEVSLTADTLGLNHFCFNNTVAVVDESYFLGKIAGFGERVFIGIPGLADVDLSLKPLRDWKPVAQLDESQIEIQLPDGHLLTLINVGIGPSGIKKGGPFTVYGQISKPSKTREQAIEFSQRFLRKDLSAEQKAVFINAIKTNPFVGFSRLTIGNDNKVSDHLDKVIGSFFDGQECG
ncbi:hypothetical protein [Aliikangiella sp. G2MR2-5]|uniref:hypothetical protein n=1 Tax=Aliikangiella sp. G2MR2-5 TaxID=2788943 RepID=UPI0018AA1538|nr:hypothetical protein [Aliikangiella sp. G2MR2-5]